MAHRDIVLHGVPFVLLRDPGAGESAERSRAQYPAITLPVAKNPDGSMPPASRVPRHDEGTLVLPLPQSAVGFPHIPGVTYTG